MQLHNADLNLFAFDYRGYGQSRFMHPSEQSLLADAESALDYLTRTRQECGASIIVIGKELGANLAAEVGAKHADVAGVVLDEPIQSPTEIIFNDPRAHLVPAHLLVSDKWDTSAAAADLLIPSLWFYASGTRGPEAEAAPVAYSKVPARKMLVWLTNSPDEERQFQTALKSWLDQLASSSR